MDLISASNVFNVATDNVTSHSHVFLRINFEVQLKYEYKIT